MRGLCFWAVQCRCKTTIDHLAQEILLVQLTAPASAVLTGQLMLRFTRLSGWMRCGRWTFCRAFWRSGWSELTEDFDLADAESLERWEKTEGLLGGDILIIPPCLVVGAKRDRFQGDVIMSGS